MSTPGDLLGALGREAKARLMGGRSSSQARVYRGRTVEELIPRIQRELGPEAIILRRRDGLTGGVLGFFQHAWVEIEAVPGTPSVDLYDEHESIDPTILDTPAMLPPSSPISAYAPMAEPAPPTPPPAPPMSPSTSYPASQPAPLSATPPPPPPTPTPHAFPSASPSAPSPPVSIPPLSLQAPLLDPTRLFARESPAQHQGASAYVTSHLAALARADRARLAQRAPLLPEVPRPAPAREQPPTVDFHELIPQDTRRAAPSVGESAPPAGAGDDWRRPHQPERRTVQPGSQGRARAGVEKSLRRYGVSGELIGELIDSATAHALPLAPRSGLAAAVRATLAQRIPVAAPLPAAGAAIVIVGAGGAGKTTTCAALLSAYRKSSTLHASFATIIREPEQGELRMLLSPQLVKPTSVDDPRALRALRKVRAEGLVVLDTPWLSPADKTGIRRLGRLLSELEPERVLVALPATLGRAAATQLLQALAPLKANGMAVTHGEETDQIGVAIEAACSFGLAPEYMLDRGRSRGWRLTRLDPTGLAAMVLP